MVVDSTSAKEGVSLASASLMAMAPVTVDVEESSVSSPMESTVITEPSSAPVMVIVMAWLEPSVAVRVKVSVSVSPSSRVLTAALALLRL